MLIDVGTGHNIVIDVFEQFNHSNLAVGIGIAFTL